MATSRPTGLVIAERSTTALPSRCCLPRLPTSSWHSARLSSAADGQPDQRWKRATVGYGTRTLLDAVSLGIDEGDAIGVVGRNGDGKTTLLQGADGHAARRIRVASRTPSGLSVGYLRQADDFPAGDAPCGT